MCSLIAKRHLQSSQPSLAGYSNAARCVNLQAAGSNHGAIGGPDDIAESGQQSGTGAQPGQAVRVVDAPTQQQITGGIDVNQSVLVSDEIDPDGVVRLDRRVDIERAEHGMRELPDHRAVAVGTPVPGSRGLNSVVAVLISIGAPATLLARVADPVGQMLVLVKPALDPALVDAPAGSIGLEAAADNAPFLAIVQRPPRLVDPVPLSTQPVALHLRLLVPRIACVLLWGIGAGIVQFHAIEIRGGAVPVVVRVGFAAPVHIPGGIGVAVMGGLETVDDRDHPFRPRADVDVLQLDLTVQSAVDADLAEPAADVDGTMRRGADNAPVQMHQAAAGSVDVINQNAAVGHVVVGSDLARAGIGTEPVRRDSDQSAT